MPPLAAAAVALAPVIVPAATVYAVVKTAEAQKKAGKLAEKQVQQQTQMQLEAGEYYEQLTREQMELQSQSSQIKTLADLIATRNQPAPRQMISLPPATQYGPVEQLNQAIGRLFRG